MKTKIFTLFAAMLLLFSANTFAQSETTMDGDVNKDGVVDVADIAAVIAKMAQIENEAAGVKYYWYVGQENPANMTSISPIVDDNSSPGWRLIGTAVPTYTMATPLWDGQINEIVFADYDDVDAYIALPNNIIKVRDGFGNDVTSQLTSLGTKSIGGVNYYIFKNKLGENICMQYSLNLLVY